MNIASFEADSEKQRIIRYFRLPSKQKYLVHRKTTCLGRPIANSEKCGCCGYMYEKDILDPMFLPQDIYYLGSGLVLYFAFIKVCCIFTLIGSLVFSGTNLYFNSTSNSCAQGSLLNCDSSFFVRLSIANKLNNNQAMEIQSYLSIATIGAMFLSLQIARLYMRNVELEAQNHLNPSHYSVMLRLPTLDYEEKDVREMIGYWWETQLNRGITSVHYEFPIEKVIISYETCVFQELIKEKKKLDKQLFREKLSHEETLSKKERLKEIDDEIKGLKFNKTSKVIVIFSYCWQLEYLVSRHEKTILRMLFPWCYNFIRLGKKRVYVTRAAMPGEIHWMNHHIKIDRKRCFRILIGLACMILIIAGQGGVFWLLYYWFTYRTRIDSQSQEYVSFLVSGMVVVVNLILQKVLSVLSKYEFRPTTLEEYVSITAKKTVAIFLNSGIILLFVYLILNTSSIWVANGFVDTLSYSFIYCLFLPHLLKYINYDVLVSSFRRLKMNGNPPEIPQAEANKVFERVQSDLHDKYGWMINLIWWGELFAPLIPIGLGCVCVTIFVHYWIQKYNFITLYREPKPFGSHMNAEMFKMLIISPFFLAAGNLGLNLIILFIRGQQLSVSVLILDLVGLGISMLVMFIPTETLDKIVRCSGKHCIQEKSTTEVSYRDKEAEFITTYQKENPIYNYISSIPSHEPKLSLALPSAKMPHKDLSIKADWMVFGSDMSSPMCMSSPMGMLYPTKVFRKCREKKTEVNVPPLQINYVTYNPTQKRAAENRLAYVTNMIAEVQGYSSD